MAAAAASASDAPPADAPPADALPARGEGASRRSACLQSTSVISASRRSRSLRSASHSRVCTTGPGRATPVVSMSTPSRAAALGSSALSALRRSWRTVQQRQPFLSTTISSSPPCRSSSWSIASSPSSFSMTSSFLPCFSLRIRLSSVDLPAPKKPVTTVTGSRRSAVHESSSAVDSIGGAARPRCGSWRARARRVSHITRPRGSHSANAGSAATATAASGRCTSFADADMVRHPRNAPLRSTLAPC